MNRADRLIPLIRPRASIFDIACWVVLAAFWVAIFYGIAMEWHKWMR